MKDDGKKLEVETFAEALGAAQLTGELLQTVETAYVGQVNEPFPKFSSSCNHRDKGVAIASGDGKPLYVRICSLMEIIVDSEQTGGELRRIQRLCSPVTCPRLKQK